MPSRRQWSVALTAALVLCATFALQAGGHFDRIEHAFSDARARLLAAEVDSDIVIVGIDAESLAAFDEWPWPRRHYARALQMLSPAAPRRVFLDIDLSSRSNADDDALLADALAAWRGTPVLLPLHFTPHGDEVRTDSVTRPLVARIGADEFVVLLSGPDADEARGFAETLLGSLRRPIPVHGVAIEVGATIGIATFPEHAREGRELLRRADVAMYGAKRRGSPIELYDPAHDGHTVRRLGMIGELRAALSTDGLDLHYQPQVNLRTGRVEAAEALLRWRHPTLGDVRPDEFIGLAESSHLIRPITQWTLHRALTDIAAWRRQGVELRIAVNLSARMLEDVDLAEQLERLLSVYAVDVTQLELEITESAMLIDPARARRVVSHLHALGIAIAVDDYGTGFSSLAYLRDLEISALKLDKSFVLELEDRDQNRVIVESTVQLAHALNLGIVAEGVETPWVHDYLTRIGYDYGQGYLFSRALPAAELAAWAASFNRSARRRAG